MTIAVLRKGEPMSDYICIAMSTIGGILLMYGVYHEKMWYIFGLSLVTGAIRLMINNKRR